MFVEKLKNLTVPSTVTEVHAHACFDPADHAVLILTYLSVALCTTLAELTYVMLPVQAEQEVKGLFSGFCTASSFNESEMVSPQPALFCLYSKGVQCQEHACASAEVLWVTCWICVKPVFCWIAPQQGTTHAQEPSACVSEQVTLQLVPWSCAVDDSQKPATLTCTPAYLQLSTEPGRHLLSLFCTVNCLSLELSMT